jgi:glycosyltransferase involved in cell wall biosynthesis
MDPQRPNGMVSVVIPAYNEPALPRVVEGVKGELARQQRPWEILVIDDASTTDCTSGIAADERVRVIRQVVNGGYGASLKEGVRRARGEVVLTIDGDGQHPPQAMGGFLAKMDAGADAVLGARTKRLHSALWRMPGKWLLRGLARYLSRRRIPDINCGYRAFRTELLRRYLPLCCDRFSFSTTAALAALLDGRKVVFLPVDTERREGRSTVVPRDGLVALLSVVQIIMLFAPLRVLLPPAAGLLAAGFGFLVYDVVTVNLRQGTMLLLVGGMLIFFFGLLADQIAAIRRKLL